MAKQLANLDTFYSADVKDGQGSVSGLILNT